MVSSIIRLWFNFLLDEYSILQLSLINIITSKSPSSLLFLDKLWDMYKSPFAMVFNKWNNQTSKIKIHKSLAIFCPSWVFGILQTGIPFTANSSMDREEWYKCRKCWHGKSYFTRIYHLPLSFFFVLF